MTTDFLTYQKVRTSAGLFDATNYYGRLFARGKDAIDLLHRMSTNDLKPLEEAKSQSVLTVLTNEKGRFVDVLKVVRDSSGDTLLITSKDKEQAVIDWLDKFVIMEDARFEPATEKITQFLICGPNATSIISRYCVQEMAETSRSSVFDLHFESANATLVKAPSVAGNGWFVLTAAESAAKVRSHLETDVLAEDGAIFDSELFEILRIENGTPIAPNEINEKHNPLELAIASEAVSFTKGCYIGQEVIARLDAQGKVQRQLVGLKFADRLPSIGDRISDESLAGVTPLGDEIGEITSIANSPSFGNIGLGYVRAKYANPGKVVSVKDNEGHKLPATIVKLPFDV
jgi:tRNA-modifying protein YgfZ